MHVQVYIYNILFIYTVYINMMYINTTIHTLLEKTVENYNFNNY